MGYLPVVDIRSLIQASPTIATLWESMVTLQDLDFSPLQETDTTYASQQVVPQHKSDMFLACAIHYNFDLPSVIRYTGGNYTAAHQDVEAIVSTLTSAGCDQQLMDEVQRIMTIGCPAYLNAESSQANFEAFAKYGNHTTITKNIAKVLKAINNETRHCYVIPFPRWIIPLCPNIHLTPQGLLIKPGKKDRMVWDGSHLPHWWSTCINMMQDRSRSPAIHFGTSFSKHLIRIWNLRITYPSQDIFLWDDDVSGAYRIPKYNPAVAGAFAYAIMSYFFLPTGGTFGSNTSPAEYEPLARARAFLASHLSRDTSLVTTHAKILDLVEFEVEENPLSVQYTQAIADDIHRGVFDPSQGRDVNTPHHPFVDDTLMADIRRHMPTAMAASIEALFLILGRDDLPNRRSNISMDKFAVSKCSWIKEQLGLIINTRSMMVFLPEVKRLRMLDLLSGTWHVHRKSFTLLEGVTLLGNLEHAASVSPWARHLYCALRSAANHCLRSSMSDMTKFPQLATMAAEVREAKTPEETELFDRFVKAKISKSLYKSKKPCFISKELSLELSFLRHIMAQPTLYKWESPIAHMVPRSPDFTSLGDSCLYAAGGFSLDLQFWWYIHWPEEIQQKTLKYYTIKSWDYTADKFVSINLLEYAAIIINYAAATHVLSTRGPNPRNPFPVLLNLADNMTANCWTQKTATSNLAGRGLARLFCALRLNNSLGLNSEFLAGLLNIIADAISRVRSPRGSAPDFTQLMQDFPELNSCHRFHPSAELLSCLMQGLLSKLGPGVQVPKTLGHLTQDNATTPPTSSQPSN